MVANHYKNSELFVLIPLLHCILAFKSENRIDPMAIYKYLDQYKRKFLK